MAVALLFSLACDKKGVASDPLETAYHKLEPITIDARHTNALETKSLIVSHDDLDAAVLPPAPLLLFGPPTQGVTWPLRHVAPDTSPDAIFTLAADRKAPASAVVMESSALLHDDPQNRRATQHLLVRRADNKTMASITLTNTPELAGCQSYDPAQVRDEPACEACLTRAGEQGSPALSCEVATLHLRGGKGEGVIDHVVTLRPALQDTATGCIDLPARAEPSNLDDVDRMWSDLEEKRCAGAASASELLGRVMKRETLCDHVALNVVGDVPAQAIVDTIAELATDHSQLLYSVSLSHTSEESLTARCKD